MLSITKLKTSFFCAAILATTGANAQSVPTYPGCDKPNSGYSRTLYIDPVSGRDNGAGTQASPYKTLQNVVSRSLLRIGDRVILKAGYHGAVDMNTVNSRALQMATQWLWLDGQPGARLTVLKITGLRKIVATGITVQDGKPYLVHLDRVRDFVLARSTLRGRSLPNYTESQWISEAPHGVNTWGGILCSSIVDNLIENVRFGIATLSDDDDNSPETNSIRSLIQGNEIQNFSGDGIRFSGSEVIVRDNVIKDAFLDQSTTADLNHDDGIQFWGADRSRSATYRNVLIEGNWIQSTTNRLRSTSTNQMHGIGHYNGNYRNVTIRENIVLTNSHEGISIGARDSIVEHNTVANHIDARNVAIHVSETKDRFFPTNTIVRQNLSVSFKVFDGATQTRNNMTYGKRPYSDFFVQFSPATNEFDLSPRPGGPLAGTGIGAVQ